MKTAYIRPAATDVMADLSLPLAASLPPVYSGQLGSRSHHSAWDEEEVEEDCPDELADSYQL